MGLARIDFAGTSRFTVKRKLGAGAMGVVFEADDADRGAPVALKVMARVEPHALLRFKNEFRALADIVHPNLVALYELMSEGGQWFFTMELVQGVSFLEWVRPSAKGTPAVTDTGTSDTAEADVNDATRSVTNLSMSSSSMSSLSGARKPGSSLIDRPLDEARLRATLPQLAEAVAALHRANRLHRDLKPSNVLVTPAGRVVVCDFGLVAELDPRAGGSARREKNVVGTVAFMSPEQAGRQTLTEASDWYAFGVMLYLSLCGRVPFRGQELEVIERKQVEAAPPPSEFAPDVPRDLEALCIELLRVRPEDRPSGDEILAWLGGRAPSRASAAAPTGRVALVGRETELRALDAALVTSREHAVTALVHGPSGMGKSALVRHWIEHVRGAVVLAGRCYERESVPYKAFDALVDEMTSYLLALPAAEAAKLLPSELWSLERLFPTLRRLEPILGPTTRKHVDLEAMELRRRAFGALKELLRRLAAVQPLVLWIDDLHWGDIDSGRLLFDLLRPPGVPDLLLVVTYRSEEATTCPVLVDLLDPRQGLATLTEVREVALRPLSPAVTRELARRLVDDDATSSRIADIVAESGGSPFFVTELVHHLQTDRSGPARAAPTGAKGQLVDALVAARLEGLGADARRLLSTVAVAGRPIEQRVILRAAGMGDDYPKVLATLRTAHLVRSTGARGEDRIESYHDRIREVAVASLSPDELREVHERLARALSAAGSGDPEALFEHYLGAGLREEARTHVVSAARQADRTFAFERAARLYQRSLELFPEGEELRALRIQTGRALSNAGRGAGAAQYFLSAVPGAEPQQALELRRLAAEKLLQSGHFDAGRAAIGEVLAQLGEVLPSSPRVALLHLLKRLVWLRLRGSDFEVCDAAEVPVDKLIHIDALWSVSSGLIIIDTIAGNGFQVKHYLLALNAGEPYRLSRALTMEGIRLATAGAANRDVVLGLIARANGLAKHIDNPHAYGFVKTGEGVALCLMGDWPAAEVSCAEGARLLRECGAYEVQWELTSVRMFMLAAMVYQGKMREVARLVPETLRELEERGNLFGSTSVRTWRTNMVWLAADDPAEARRQVEEARRQWSQDGFHRQHYHELVSLGQIMLYDGDAAGAGALLASRWELLERSLLMRVQIVRVEVLALRARCALATAGNDLVQARRDVRQVSKENVPWARCIAAILEAGLAARDGRTADAIAALERAEDRAREASMGLFGAVAALRRGQLMGGDAGARVRAAAEAWMRGQDIVRPDRFAGMLAPGFDGPTSRRG